MSDSSEPETLLPASLHLGRVSGMPVGLHCSCLIIAGLITDSLADRLRMTQPDREPTRVWGVAVATAGPFFVTLLVHELSHSLVARARGLLVHSITHFALEGIPHIERDANTAKTEFVVAIAGWSRHVPN